MDDEFALCWNNFQDNIASGFQNLYDRGYLVDVTLACDGKLLQAHKIVLAICSPYFQEMFIANPCKHPIIVLKDISSTVMTELLQFMYQGVVNVKHAELSTFMKIAQTLQIKGLATSSTSKSNQFVHDQDGNERMSDINEDSPSNNRKNSESKLNLSSMVSQRLESSMTQPSCSSSKRNIDHEHMSMKKHCKRYSDMDAQNLNATSMELSTSDDVALPPVPQISMVESRFDINSVKREISDMPVSPGSMRNSVPSHFNFDYNVYQPRNIEYPNELHAENDFPKSAGNYNDIPAGSNITMLTSTSLLHGNCIFNRNNTVATQQGMKTYWLCKSYRITMCRARCITHQGRIISATGVHNHQPHMKPSGSNDLFNPFINSVHSGMQQSGGNDSNLSNTTTAMSGGSNVRMPQNANTSHNVTNQQQQHLPFHSSQQYSSGYHQMHYPPELQGQHNYSSNNAAVLQNMMQNVLSQNNLMHLTNMAPMLNPLSQYSSPASNSSVGLNKMQLAADNYASFSQTSRNNDESQILESQNINTAASMISSPNRGNSGCENYSSSNNSNTVNSNNNSKNPSGTISIKDGGSNENNNNSIKSNNNNTDENIYYSGETGNNNTSRSSESISSNTNISSRVSNNNNDNGNNDPQNHITNDNVSQNNSSKNIANNDNHSSSNNDGSNSSSSNIMSARSSVNSTIVPVCTPAVESNCDNVPPIASDLSESNLISISPTQITFKIERT